MVCTVDTVCPKMSEKEGGLPSFEFFGTVSTEQTIQTLDVLALYNLFMGSPGTVARNGRTADAQTLTRMPRNLGCRKLFCKKTGRPMGLPVLVFLVVRLRVFVL